MNSHRRPLVRICLVRGHVNVFGFQHPQGCFLDVASTWASG